MMKHKKFDPFIDYIHDLYSPSSDEEKRKLELAQKELDDFLNHVAITDNSIPGYENVPVDEGVLSRMLTDEPEIRKAALTWMNSLPAIDECAIKRVIASKKFRDMYGAQPVDWKGNINWSGRKDIGVGNIASAITQNDLGRSFEVTETKEDTDGNGDTDKMTIEKKEE